MYMYSLQCRRLTGELAVHQFPNKATFKFVTSVEVRTKGYYKFHESTDIYMWPLCITSEVHVHEACYLISYKYCKCFPFSYKATLRGAKNATLVLRGQSLAYSVHCSFGLRAELFSRDKPIKFNMQKPHYNFPEITKLNPCCNLSTTQL